MNASLFGAGISSVLCGLRVLGFRQTYCEDPREPEDGEEQRQGNREAGGRKNPIQHQANRNRNGLTDQDNQNIDHHDPHRVGSAFGGRP